MRAFSIICVVLLTQLLLLTSNVSSTPTKYLTSNPHSPNHDDTHDNTHDDIRVLRVGDARNTQERGVSLDFEPLLKLFPWTTSADVARIENLVKKTTHSNTEPPNLARIFLEEGDDKWTIIKAVLLKNVKPESLRLFLSKHLVSNEEIMLINDQYTSLYNKMQVWKSSKFADSYPIEKFVDYWISIKRNQNL